MRVLKWMGVRAKPQLLLVAAGLALAAAIGGAQWTGGPHPGLAVFVRQADGTPVFGATVTATRTDGQQQVLTELGSDDPAEWMHLYLGVEEAGTYSLHVERAGYAPVTIDVIRILEGDFYGGSIYPVDVLVKMRPVSPAAKGARAKGVPQ